eukprot:TRINITY_DN63218_c0_g1_i1.p1 TRINITY_DN63218_c0_g1~~TRINITY_DN63218_c0_g1_i1.p1  ORF type:complete len:194 (+),score=16.64 TRINITY_DN63218_c0_g1_i1:42-584(+)
MVSQLFCIGLSAIVAFRTVDAAAAKMQLRGALQARELVESACFTEKQGGKNYRGNVSVTVSGRKCQKWTSNMPWNGTMKYAATAGNGLGDHNFCRNPGGDLLQPWCFTTDANPQHMIEVCDVPRCMSEETASGKAGCPCSQSGTVAGAAGSVTLLSSRRTEADCGCPLLHRRRRSSLGRR